MGVSFSHRASGSVSVSHSHSGIPDSFKLEVEAKALEKPIRVQHAHKHVVVMSVPPSVARLLDSVSLLLQSVRLPLTVLCVALCTLVMAATIVLLGSMDGGGGKWKYGGVGSWSWTGFTHSSDRSKLNGSGAYSDSVTLPYITLLVICVIVFAFGDKIESFLKSRAKASEINSLSSCVNPEVISVLADAWCMAMGQDRVWRRVGINVAEQLFETLHVHGFYADLLGLAKRTESEFKRTFGARSVEYWRAKLALATAEVAVQDPSKLHAADRELCEILHNDEGNDENWILRAKLLQSVVDFRLGRLKSALEICDDILLDTAKTDGENPATGAHILFLANKAVLLYEMSKSEEAVDVLKQLPKNPSLSLDKASVTQLMT